MVLVLTCEHCDINFRYLLSMKFLLAKVFMKTISSSFNCQTLGLSVDCFLSFFHIMQYYFDYKKQKMFLIFRSLLNQIECFISS